MKEKRSKLHSASIDVIDRESHVVLCRFHYCPLVSGDYEVARNLAVHFVRDYCARHHFEVTSYQFFDHYHAACWSLIS